MTKLIYSLQKKINYIKIRILKIAVSVVRRLPVAEKALIYLLTNRKLGEKFKVGAIATAYNYLTKSVYRTANLGKYKIYVNVAESQGINLFFFKKNQEGFSSQIVSELLEHSDVCIDIGANMGSYTLLMAHEVGSTGRVFAFEPNPDLYSMLLKSITINELEESVFPEKLAAYNKSGEKLKFYISTNPNNSGTSSIVNHGVYVSEENFVEVSSITLDDYCRAKQLHKIKLVKIDVERAELEVIKGMKETLRQGCITYILLESFSGDESQRLLESFGYDGWFIDEQKQTLKILEKNENKGVFGNYLFVKLDCLGAFKARYNNIIEN